MDILNQGCVSVNGEISAAQAASNHSLNIYDDWFIPSINELEVLYDYCLEQNIELKNSFNSAKYWSSTEYNNLYAWTLSFDIGQIHDTNAKDSNRHIRVIRSF